MSMKLLKDLTKQDLDGKKVLVRVDFNVAVEAGKITEPFKIAAAKPTIEYLVNNGAIVTLASHIESVGSFEGLREQVNEILGMKVNLLENTRANEGEKKDDIEFAKILAKGHDLYVNDAFAAAHRAHASTHVIATLLPSYAGFLMEKEVTELTKAIDAPADGKVVVLGGAKIGTKLPMIKNFTSKAEWILIGGAIANNFFKYHKLEIGKSLFDADFVGEIAGIERKNIFVPEDLIVSTDLEGKETVREAPEKGALPGEYILDIGPRTAKYFAEHIKAAKLVIWNGPMGKSEVPAFAEGTKIVAEAIANNPNSIIGGGDTIAIVDALVPGAKFGYVSTGGGAMLSFLGGEELPALKALGYYE